MSTKNCKVPHGYNRTDGGDGVVGYTPAPQHRANISAALSGRHLSPEHCKNISISKSGENNPHYGKHCSPSEIEVKIRVEVGEPAQEIVNAAQNFDLIVMGSRGFGGMDDSTGSVAKFVQENCSKPVILAKGMPNDWDNDNNFVGGTNWKD